MPKKRGMTESQKSSLIAASAFGAFILIVMAFFMWCAVDIGDLYHPVTIGCYLAAASAFVWWLFVARKMILEGNKEAALERIEWAPSDDEIKAKFEEWLKTVCPKLIHDNIAPNFLMAYVLAKPRPTISIQPWGHDLKTTYVVVCRMAEASVSPVHFRVQASKNGRWLISYLKDYPA